jgi:NAD(P)-dependent dehydrogenase (short-subunit alcohol dehydrogenase family)
MTFERVTFDFSGISVLITGGSRGIGFEIASRFSQAGALVTITGRRAESLANAKARLDGSCHVVVGDAADPEHARAAVAEAVKRFGPLGVLVNNVGGSPYAGPLVDVPEDKLFATFRRNVASALRFTHEAWHQSMAERGGVVIMLGSLGGLRVRRDNGTYGVAKAALHHVTRQLAIELAPAVRVVSIIPGLVRTDFGAIIFKGREESLAAEIPLGRLGEAEDVAYLTLTVASPAAGWLTGVDLVTDGGASLVAGPGAMQPLIGS